MTQEYMPLRKTHIARARNRLNTDTLSCHKCGIPLKEGDSVHHQRHFFYCESCWKKAYLDAEDEP